MRARLSRMINRLILRNSATTLKQNIITTEVQIKKLLQLLFTLKIYTCWI